MERLALRFALIRIKTKIGENMHFRLLRKTNSSPLNIYVLCMYALRIHVSCHVFLSPAIMSTSIHFTWDLLISYYTPSYV